MRRVVARTGHEIPARDPVRLAVGDEVDVGERSDEWPEFVFVTAAHGAGWVPRRYLSGAAGTVVVQVGYDTTELPTRAGDVLDVLDDDMLSGWLWCRAASGREGWVPATSVIDRRQADQA